MKILITNFGGNSGKSTIARNIFKDNLPNYKLINNKNEDFNEKIEITIKSKKELAANMMKENKIIVDINAQSLENYIEYLHNISFLSKFDKVVIPMTSGRYGLDKVKYTLQRLVDIYKISSSKIYIIPNMCDDSLKYQYEEIKKINFPNEDNSINIDPNIYLENIDFINYLYTKNQTINDIINDTKDYEKLIKNEDNEQKQLNYLNSHITKAKAARKKEEIIKILSFVMEGKE